MSAHPKTSDEEIRAAARKLIEEKGVDRLSMQAVANTVGIRAPSLYKRFSSKGELLQAVTEDALRDLQTLTEASVSPGDPQGSLERMADAYRAFAKDNPQVYTLIFEENSHSDRGEVLLEARLASVAPLLHILSGALGAETALVAARTLAAFLHGFVSMELSGAFHFGGDVDSAFRFGLKTILAGLLPEADKTDSH